MVLFEQSFEEIKRANHGETSKEIVLGSWTLPAVSVTKYIRKATKNGNQETTSKGDIVQRSCFSWHWGWDPFWAPGLERVPGKIRRTKSGVKLTQLRPKAKKQTNRK